MSLTPSGSPVERVLAAARSTLEASTQQVQDEGEPGTEYAQVMGRLRQVSQQARDATSEQTLLLAYARIHLMPPPSFHALADATGMSYSGVRQRLTPEVLAAVRGASRALQESQAGEGGL